MSPTLLIHECTIRRLFLFPCSARHVGYATAQTPTQCEMGINAVTLSSFHSICHSTHAQKLHSVVHFKQSHFTAQKNGNILQYTGMVFCNVFW